MRFLIQIPQLIYGGAEKVLVNFANVLVEHGHEVEVLEIYEKGLLKSQFDSRVTFHAICSKEYTKKYYASWNEIIEEPHLTEKAKKCAKLGFSKIVGYRKFAEYLCGKYYENKEYDVAINYLEIESPRFLLNNITANKYLQWYHTDVANLDNPEETDKLINVFRKMDKIICVSQNAKDNFVRRYPELESKTVLLYNFFDVDQIIKYANESFTFNTSEFVMLSVGRLTEQKNYLRFIEVLNKLHKEGYSFEWHVLGIGIQEEEIKAKIHEYGLQKSIFLDGVTENPYKYMKNCDLFVLPSGWEGFPTVTIEAKILGRPVLATDVSGIKEQLVHGKTGWIVENNEEALYEGLKFLLNNKDVIQQISSNESMDRLWSYEQKYIEFMNVVMKETECLN